MDDSDKPTLETEGLSSEKEDGWTMPEPIFRSTPGTTPKNSRDLETDIPTEAANKPDSGRQSVRPKEEGHSNRHDHTGKKRGRRRVSTATAILIGLIAGSAVVAIIYFLFYYGTWANTF